MSKDTRANRPAVTPYKKINKQPVSAAEKARNRKSLKSYNIYDGGGNDCA